MSIFTRPLIIGCGFVGKALADTMRETPWILDPRHPDTVESLAFALAQKPGIIFICLPTPPDANGECDASVVVNYCAELKRSEYAGLVVIKSTIATGAVESINAMLPNVVIWPELLREAFAYHDMCNPNLTVIGALREIDAKDLVAFIEKGTRIVPGDVAYVYPVEASMFKYLTNSFLATKVVFMHEAYKWMMSRPNGNAESHKRVVNLLAMEGRVGNTHLMAPGTHGLGFGGACFPKDTQALVAQAQRDGARLHLLEAAIAINNHLRSDHE